MIAAGEAGGILDTILERLAIYIEKAVKLQGQVTSAMIYPVAVITIATVVVGRDPLEGHPDVRGAVHRARRGAAAAHAHRRRAQRGVRRVAALAGWRGRRRRRSRSAAMPPRRHGRRVSWTGGLLALPVARAARCGRSPSRGSAARSARSSRRASRSSTGWTSPPRPAATPSSRTRCWRTRRSIERGETHGRAAAADARCFRRWSCR